MGIKVYFIITPLKIFITFFIKIIIIFLITILMGTRVNIYYFLSLTLRRIMINF